MLRSLLCNPELSCICRVRFSKQPLPYRMHDMGNIHFANEHPERDVSIRDFDYCFIKPHKWRGCGRRGWTVWRGNLLLNGVWDDVILRSY
jgi:hypothetical protein